MLIRLAILVLLTGCSGTKAGKSSEDKWTLVSDMANYYGLYRYEDADVICYVYERSSGGSLQCFPKKR